MTTLYIITNSCLRSQPDELKLKVEMGYHETLEPVQISVETRNQRVNVIFIGVMGIPTIRLMYSIITSRVLTRRGRVCYLHYVQTIYGIFPL